jgi:hypothetical protein
MTKPITGAVVAAMLAAAAGCGGHTRVGQRPQQPRLPRALAADLAGRSDLVAARLDAGDACGALAAAKDLQRRAVDAINAHEVPGPLQEPLAGAAASLTVKIRCAPPAPPPHDHGKHGGEKKHGKNGEGD